jgi:hypothetical protein
MVVVSLGPTMFINCSVIASVCHDLDWLQPPLAYKHCDLIIRSTLYFYNLVDKKLVGTCVK